MKNKIKTILNMFFFIFIIYSTFTNLYIMDTFASNHKSPENLKKNKDKSFQIWIKNFKKVALKHGVSSKTYNLITKNLKQNKHIFKRDKNQPEFIKTTLEYLSKSITNRKLTIATQKLNENYSFLNLVEKKYNIPKQILVSLWGMETFYGKIKGQYSLRSSLATLAYKQRRSKFFRMEFLIYLRLVQKGILKITDKGSWAGAIGHMQFMPSTLQRYGVDWNKDNKIDIINNKYDALASAANYLNSMKWSKKQTWGQQVKLPVNFKYYLYTNDFKHKKSLSFWRRIGIKKINNQNIANNNKIKSVLYLPQGKKGPAFLLYSNFFKIYKWNHSLSYALSICLFSDLIIKKPHSLTPEDIKIYKNKILNYKTKTIFKVQKKLNKLNYYKYKIDGLFGRRLSKAIKKYQIRNGISPDGYLSKKLLRSLNIK